MVIHIELLHLHERPMIMMIMMIMMTHHGHAIQLLRAVPFWLSAKVPFGVQTSDVCVCRS